MIGAGVEQEKKLDPKRAAYAEAVATIPRMRLAIISTAPIAPGVRACAAQWRERLTPEQYRLVAAQLVDAPPGVSTPAGKANYVTVEKAAVALGLRQSSVASARLALRHLPPEMLDLVADGKLRMKTARAIMELPEETRAGALTRALAAGPEKRLAPGSIEPIQRVRRHALAMPRGTDAERITFAITNTLEHVENGMAVLESYTSRPLPEGARSDWHVRIARIQRILRRFSRRCEERGDE